MLEQQKENQRNAQAMSCRYLRDETVDGEAAAVYFTQTTEARTGKSQATVWVSKRTGLPLRSEDDIGAGDQDTLHMVLHYDYANVRPPAGVK